jgi:hypothetical protein
VGNVVAMDVVVKYDVKSIEFFEDNNRANNT